MTSTTIFEIISLVSFSLSGVLFIAAVIAFYKLKIPQTIGYLTGKTAQKNIQKIQTASYNREEKTTGGLSQEKFVTDKLAGGKARRGKKARSEKLSTSVQNATTVLNDGNSTTVLSMGDVTTVLAQEQQNGSEQAPIQQSQSTEENKKINYKVDFNIETDIKFIHTNEIIS